MKTTKHGLSEKEMELVQLLMADCETTGDVQAKLKKLFAGTIEQMLDAEMDEHLGYEKNRRLGTTLATAETAMEQRQSAAITGNVKLLSLVIGTVNLSQKSFIFIACHDNLTGLCDAITSIFPKTKNQLCIVHKIRNSCKFVPYKDRKAVCADLKKIYGAVNLDDAEYAKEEFREKWDKKYPNILKSWNKSWAELTVFF